MRLKPSSRQQPIKVLGPGAVEQVFVAHQHGPVLSETALVLEADGLVEEEGQADGELEEGVAQNLEAFEIELFSCSGERKGLTKVLNAGQSCTPGSFLTNL